MRCVRLELRYQCASWGETSRVGWRYTCSSRERGCRHGLASCWNSRSYSNEIHIERTNYGDDFGSHDGLSTASVREQMVLGIGGLFSTIFECFKSNDEDRNLNSREWLASARKGVGDELLRIPRSRAKFMLEPEERNERTRSVWRQSRTFRRLGWLKGDSGYLSEVSQFLERIDIRSDLVP
jgi:hypothetical protein